MEDTREIVLRAAPAGADGELFEVWSAARAEANRAFAAWGERPGSESYAAYRAAEDRADAAEDACARSSRRPPPMPMRCPCPMRRPPQNPGKGFARDGPGLASRARAGVCGAAAVGRRAAPALARARRPPATGPARLGLDEAAADRVAHELDAVAHAELAQQVGAVGLDRLLGEVQDLGDLRVGVRLGDQLDDLLLARRERLARPGGVVLHPGADERALGGVGQERLAAPDRPRRVDEVLVGLLLEHVARGARP